MASWMVHLRIADELLKHLNKIDETAFVMGNIAPDSGVPNADWTEFHPPKELSHFKTYTDIEGTSVFREQYFDDDKITKYSLREYSFFLGYYVHLLTDIQWKNSVYKILIQLYEKEFTEDKNQLIWAAKGDWYDLDFLYLEQHPDFHAFYLYENAVGFNNDFMDIFSTDAFENRRQYICGFYHSNNHGELHREYKYLTPKEADAFVINTTRWILEHEKKYF